MRFERSLQFAESMVRDGVVPSAAVAVGRADERYATAVYGQACTRPGKLRAGPDTLYDLASLTKPIATAMTALRLAAEGKLSLYDGIGQYMDAPEDKRAITLIELLTHTGGLPAHTMLEQHARTPEEALDVILGLPLIKPAGADVVYSCLGYILLGEILARAGGMKLDRLAARCVFEPLGMDRTGYNPGGGDAAATEPDETGRPLMGVAHDENARFLGGVAGNAGLFSTVGDVAKFAAMLSGHGGKYLPEQAYALFVRNHTPGMSESRGIGLSIADGRKLSCGEFFPSGSFGHTGFTGTSFWVDGESGLYAVLLTNAVQYGRGREAFFRARRLWHNIIMNEFQDRR